MIDVFSPDAPLYLVQVVDAQIEAWEIIGRALTADELYQVKKGLEAGLGVAQSISMRVAIEDAISDPEVDHLNPLSLDYYPFKQLPASEKSEDIF